MKRNGKEKYKEIKSLIILIYYDTGLNRGNFEPVLNKKYFEKDIHQ